MDILEMTTFIPTCEALSIIYGIQESDADTFKSFVYTGYLMESGMSSDIVMEGVLDIFKSIANGIKKFIEKIKEFFKKILLYISSSSADLDKVAEQVKPIIKDKTDIKFDIDGYRFTVISKNGPSMNEFQRIVSEYNSDMDDITKLKDAEIKKKITDWMSDNNLEKLRGEVLGSGNSILEDDFLDTIREYYRDGMTQTETISVDRTMVNEILNHAKRLEDTKKSTIKDRDTLVTLLSKTEAFFDKTLPTMYKGNRLQANTAKIDVTDNKFSKTDNYQNIADSATKLLSTYATFKSRQVNKIASMINLVACERVNALKDQIKQERIILRKCLFESKDEDKVKVDESVTQIFPDMGYAGRDYVTYAMEASLIEQRYYNRLSQMVLLNEATFLSQSFQTGRVHYLMEADMDSGVGKVKNTIGQIIETVIASFRKKAMGEAERYKPWVAEIRDGLVEKAKAKKEFKMANFADADYNAMANTIMASIRKAYASKNYEDTGFAKDIISSFTDFEKINDDSSRAIMLNYFRTGKADAKLDTVTMSGTDLVNRLPAMLKYIDQYGSTVTKPSESISKTFKSQSEGFKVTESMAGDSFLDLIGRPVCESDVTACVDYNMMFGQVCESGARTWVTEADGVKIGRGTEGLSDANKSMGEQAKATGAAGEAEAKEVKSATQVSSTEDKTAEGTGEKKTNNAATNYKRNVDRFFKNCITLYIKAREEQFLAYVNALADIDGARPKFDKNGKYIPKEMVKKEETEAVQTESK